MICLCIYIDDSELFINLGHGLLVCRNHLFPVEDSLEAAATPEATAAPTPTHEEPVQPSTGPSTFANGDHDGSAGKTETDVVVKNDQVEQNLGDTKDVKDASKVDEKNGSGSEPEKVKDDEEDTKNKETPQDQEKTQQMPPVNDNDNKPDEELVGLKRDASVVDVTSPTAEKRQEAHTEMAFSPSDPKKQRLEQSEMTEETRQDANTYTRDVEDGTEAEDRPEEMGDEQEEEADEQEQEVDEQEQEVDEAPATPQPRPKKTNPHDAKNNDKNEKAQAKAKAKKEKKEQQPTPKKKHEKKESKSKEKEPTQKRTKKDGKKDDDDTEAKRGKRKSKAEDEAQALRKASVGTRSGTVTVIVILFFPFQSAEG